MFGTWLMLNSEVILLEAFDPMRNLTALTIASNSRRVTQ